MVTPSGRRTTISSFSTNCTRRVCARKAGTAEATNCSPSPRPTTSGHSRRAPTSSSGSSAWMRHERVVAAQLGERGPHGSDQVTLVVTRDEVRDDLGVGLGGEDAAALQQFLLERHVVLDDPVDDDVDPIGGVEVRMGVLLAYPAVRSPARVPDADGGGGVGDGHGGAAVACGRAGRELGLELVEVAHRAHRLDVIADDQRDAGAVVAPVLQPSQAGEDELLGRALSDVANDAAHRRGSFPSSMRTHGGRRPGRGSPPGGEPV